MSTVVNPLSLDGLKGVEQAQAYAADAYYQASARNKASQSQATLVVKLPIHDGVADADKLVVSRAVAEEVVDAYYSKLLEDTIGVQPHAHAVKAAADAVGLNFGNVQQHIRVLGGSLQVAGTAPRPDSPPGLPAGQLQLIKALQPVLQLQEGSSHCRSAVGGHVSQAALQASLQQEDNNTFARYVHLYTYPYSKQQTLRKATTADKQTAVATARATILKNQVSSDGSACKPLPKRRCAQAAAAILADSTYGDVAATGFTPRGAAAGGGGGGGGPAVHRGVCFSPDVPHHQVLSSDQLLELSQELSATPRVIHSHQSRFAADMTSHLLHHHQHELTRWDITAHDVSAVADLLTTPAVIKVALTLMHYMHTRFITDSSCVTLQLAQRIQAQAQADRRTKLVTAAQRPTMMCTSSMLLSSGAGSSAIPAAAESNTEYDSTFKWDMGCQLLLERKAEAAAEIDRQLAAAAATAAQQAAQRQALLPSQLNKGCRRLGLGAAPGGGVLSSAGSRECLSLRADTDAAATVLSDSGSSTAVRPASSVRLLQRQGSDCSDSSKSRHSVISSVSSYKQAVSAAQYQSQLLAGASTDELQSCRISSMLQAWDDIVATLRRSPHGVTFAIPTLLLSLQVLAHSVFTAALPTWCLTKQGAAALQQITDTTRHLLDPQQCYNTFMVLAGGPAAIAVRQTCDAGPVVVAGRRCRRLGLSSVVSAAVGPQPGSAATRRMMVQAAARKTADSATRLESVVLGAEHLHSAAAHKMTRLLNSRS